MEACLLIFIGGQFLNKPQLQSQYELARKPRAAASGRDEMRLPFFISRRVVCIFSDAHVADHAGRPLLLLVDNAGGVL